MFSKGRLWEVDSSRLWNVRLGRPGFVMLGRPQDDQIGLLGNFPGSFEWEILRTSCGPIFAGCVRPKKPQTSETPGNLHFSTSFTF